MECCENYLLRFQMRKDALTVETKESLENLRYALLSRPEKSLQFWVNNPATSFYIFFNLNTL
jgi:hypothetical protein